MLCPTYHIAALTSEWCMCVFQKKGLGTSAGRPAYRLLHKKAHTQTRSVHKVLWYIKSAVGTLRLDGRFQLCSKNLRCSTSFAWRFWQFMRLFVKYSKGGVAQSWQCSSPSHSGSKVGCKCENRCRKSRGVSNRQHCVYLPQCPPTLLALFVSGCSLSVREQPSAMKSPKKQL